MKYLQTLLTVSFAASVAIAPAAAQAEVAAVNSVRDLITVSGQEEDMRLSIEALLPVLRQMAKDIPEENIRQLMDSERILASAVKTYQKYFTEEEVKDMLSFYRTPTGAKLAKLNSKIQKEATEQHYQNWRTSLINEQIQKSKLNLQQPGQVR